MNRFIGSGGFAAPAGFAPFRQCFDARMAKIKGNVRPVRAEWSEPHIRPGDSFVRPVCTLETLAKWRRLRSADGFAGAWIAPVPGLHLNEASFEVMPRCEKEKPPLSSGMSRCERKDGSVMGRPYGSQYHAVMTVGNVKFVSKNSRQSEPLMETMTRGRVYVHVEGDEIKSIVYFDSEGKRSKRIDVDHSHLGVSPHVHDGYYHSDFRKNLITEERAMVDGAVELWEKYKQSRL